MTRVLLLMAVLSLWATPVQAHKASDSYLTLEVDGARVALRWDVALRDLDEVLGLDEDDDGRLTWGEVQRRWDEIQAYMLSRLDVRMGHSLCGSGEAEPLMDRHTDGAYAVLRVELGCTHPTLRMEVDYRLLFDVDAQHRGLVKVTSPEGTTSVIFSPDHRREVVTVGASRGWGSVLAYAHEGVHHIWAGLDHLLFLFALLVPSVLRRTPDGWVGATSARAVVGDVTAVVTAFTAAHSITLTLAVLQVVTLPSRVVESVIAASVVLAAINNVVPLVRERRWVVAFLFGLVHGFGFAGALADLGLAEGAQALALAGFNLGVEAGQLAVAALVLPLSYALRHRWMYRRVVLAGGSCAIAIVALCWAIERVYDVELLRF